MWGRVLILAALTLAAAWPPAAAHAHVTLAQEIRVEIGVDRSERIHWSARATNTLVEGILLPPGASVANVTAYGTPLVSTQTTRADGRVLVEPARRTTQMDVEARLAPPSGELHPLYSRR